MGRTVFYWDHRFLGGNDMGHKRLFLVTSVIGVGIATQAANGQFARWSDNGHWYEAVDNEGPICWTEARDAAEARGGYLVTITSQAENEFICSRIIDNLPPQDPEVSKDLWLGGFQPPGTGEPDGGWEWVTGEGWNYTNWQDAQPDDAGGGEDYLTISDAEGAPGRCRWNDLPDCPGNPQNRHRYIVEYDAYPAVQWTVEEGGNGHWYQFVDHGGPICWTEADATSEAEGAYLVTITSQAESDFVCTEIIENLPSQDLGVSSDLWLGGFQPPDTGEPAEGWEWVTGETWDYTNWQDAQPDDAGGGEDYLSISDAEGHPDRCRWNDLPDCPGNPQNRHRYIIEFCEGDADDDLRCDADDNCPDTPNSDQCDFDGDELGDVCDDDIDGDGVPNDEDVCDFTPPAANVQPDGTLRADLDGDCDADLADFYIFQTDFTGASDHCPLP